MRKVTGRAYTRFFNSCAVKVFFIRGGMLQVVLGIHDIFFILVTEKTEARLFVLFDYEQILFDLTVMHPVACLAYYLSFAAKFCSPVKEFFFYSYIDRLHIDDMERLPFAFRRKYLLVLVAGKTEP